MWRSDYKPAPADPLEPPDPLSPVRWQRTRISLISFWFDCGAFVTAICPDRFCAGSKHKFHCFGQGHALSPTTRGAHLGVAAVAWQGSGHGDGHATTSISTSLFLSTKQLIDDSAAVKATALREKGARGSFATQLAACCISAVVAINSEIGQRQLERRRMLQACLPARPPRGQI